MNPTTPILVTGAGGFIAAHTVLTLLAQGYRVRGTLRDLKRAPELRATLAEHSNAADRVEFVAADLMDVRDVAAALSAAMTVPEAAGQRFCCVAITPWLHYIALTLRKHFAARGYNVPTRVMPSFLVRALGLIDPKIRVIVPSLDWDYDFSNEHIKTVLGWQPHPPEQTIVDMGESLIRLGLV